MRAHLAAILLVAGCASSGGSSTDTAPVLAITSPDRGTSADGGMVTVTGTATDDQPGVRVTVNGVDQTVGKDGSFSATIQVDPGIGIIETHAIDKGGHDVRDVRAVLAGSIATTDGTKVAPIGAHASTGTLAAIAKAVAADAEAIDYTAEATKLNPIYNDTSCNGAVVDIQSVTMSGVDVGLVPQQGSMATDVTLHNVVVKLNVHFRALCIGGSDTVTISASSAHISGDLGVTVSSGKLVASLANAQVALNGFNLSAGGVPGFVVDLFNGTVRSKVEGALQHVVATKVPPLANAKLNGLLAKGFSASVLGADTTLTVTPTTATISGTGIFLGVDTKVLVTGGTGGMFAEQTPPAASTLMSQTRNLGLAIANDLVNQLLAGLWAAGAFDKTVPVSSLSVLAALLDPDATQLAIKLSLPPTVQSDGTGNLQLALGDAILSVEDASGNELQKISLSLKTSIAMSASTSGAISMALGNPTVYAQVLGQVDDGSRALTDQQVEGIVTGAWGVVSQQAGDALGKLPMPSVAGVKLGAPTVQALSNYVVADIPVQ
jgi:hypothetical protein